MISHRLGLWVLLIGGAMAVAIGAVRLVAHSLPAPPLSLTNPTCAQSCWQGIRPGFSTRAEFSALQTDVFRYQVSATYRDDGEEGLVREVLLTMRGDVLLGDVMNELGPPSHAQLSWVAGMPSNNRSGGRRIYVGATLYFADGLVMVEVVRPDCVWRLSPRMIVRRVRYFAPSSMGGVIPIGTPSWQGFGTLPQTINAAC